MPIKSYLIFPQPGKEDLLLDSLRCFPQCEVIPSDDVQVFVLITDTSNATEEDSLERMLQQDTKIHHINLVSGFTT